MRLHSFPTRRSSDLKKEKKEKEKKKKKKKKKLDGVGGQRHARAALPP
jgi:hypothetical protein